MIRVDLSWSELISVDPTRTGDPSRSGPTFVPAYSGLHCNKGSGKLASESIYYFN